MTKSANKRSSLDTMTAIVNNSGHITMTDDGMINELFLVAKLEAKAVLRLYLVQDEDGKFEIFVKLKLEEEERRLVTQRKTPRKWSSLDRLTRHMNENYSNVPTITLKLRSNNERSKPVRKSKKGKPES